MANAWFRLYAEFATDPKVQMLSESDQRRLVMLFCFRCNNDVTLQDEEVTFLLRISNDEWQQTKALFIARGFIDESNEILNWDKRQFKSDTSKNRVNAYRERKKQESNSDVTLQKRKSNALDTDTEQIQIQSNKNIAQKSYFFAGIDQNLVSDYLAVRKAKKAPAVSKTVFDGLVRESQLAGIDLSQALRVCVERNWVGFKADWYISSNRTSSNQPSIAEQNKLSTEMARIKLFGVTAPERDVTHESTEL
jgi:hypothetical protein